MKFSFSNKVKISVLIGALTIQPFCFATSIIDTTISSLNSSLNQQHHQKRNNFMVSNRVKMDDERDQLRHPNELIDFLQIKPGDIIADIGSGDGYTSMYLARATGSTGKVYAHNTPAWLGFLRPLIQNRLKEGPIAGVEWIEYPFSSPIPNHINNLDLVTNVLTYHDTLYMDVDRDKMNRNIFNALRSGGRYVVVDHAALDKDGDTVGHSLHRISERFIIDEIQKAGFILKNSAPFLRYDADNKKGLAWKSPQPRTDRFVLSFIKP